MFKILLLPFSKSGKFKASFKNVSYKTFEPCSRWHIRESLEVFGTVLDGERKRKRIAIKSGADIYHTMAAFQFWEPILGVANIV